MSLPFAYAEEDVAHGYAMTIHKAQGATYDHCLVLGSDQLTSEAGYTAMSRGRIDNTLYLATESARDETHGSEVAIDIVDRARSSFKRSAAQEMALDRTPSRPPEAEADFGIDL